MYTRKGDCGRWETRHIRDYRCIRCYNIIRIYTLSYRPCRSPRAPQIAAKAVKNQNTTLPTLNLNEIARRRRAAAAVVTRHALHLLYSADGDKLIYLPILYHCNTRVPTSYNIM